ncbi:F-box only protein 15 isoform X2 [Diceros bicornis minor]|uniref:F-box only protein 15 isoform X2 n=1 Tax=Diceros bicornis minor TaxID=77932 RepID=UPI0026F08C53|nr:F-box only protein 15 isoform X2 [Diceros bicornis minor]
MATGRGRLLQLHWSGLQASGLQLGAVGWAPGRARHFVDAEESAVTKTHAKDLPIWISCPKDRKGPGVTHAAGSTTMRPYARRKNHCEKRSATCSVSLDCMPSEILLKIFSYLDAVTLLGAGCVSRRFYHLASDNFIWIRLYSTAFSPKRSNWKVNSVEKTAMSMNFLSVEDKEAGYWKKEYVTKQIASVKAALTQVLKPVNPYTGFPVKTKMILRPRWHSLIANYDLSNLTESTMVGCDRLVRIFCLNPGLLVGLWKREEELAFVMANLHIHHLVERSTLGSATIPYELPPHSPVLDDSPEYGLYGYQLHVDMHSSGISYLCGTFHDLFTKKGYIENGYVKLTAINFKNNAKHLPLIGKVGFYWRTDVLDGFIKTCSVMDITLLDEYRKPFWCFSSPVCVRSSPRPSDGPNFLGQTYYVDYVDSEGKVHVELLWIEETEEYFIVSLVLYLSVAKINHWFGTEY